MSFGQLHPDQVARYEREHREAEAARHTRQAAYEAELDAEVDAQIAADNNRLTGDSGDEMTERLVRLEREAAQQRGARRATTRPGADLLPDGFLMRQDQIRLRRESRELHEREQREEALGLPAMQGKWDSRAKAIAEARDATIRRAEEVCRVNSQAAKEAAEVEIAELGPRPVLADLEIAA